jgi:hypothetical protein
MKAARQVEAVELMIASNTITVAHAEALLKAFALNSSIDKYFRSTLEQNDGSL